MTLFGVLINDAEYSIIGSPLCLVMNKIPAPNLIHCAGSQSLFLVATQSPTTPLLFTDLLLVASSHTLNPLAIHSHPFSLHQSSDSTVAISRVLITEFNDSFAERQTFMAHIFLSTPPYASSASF